jgi:hypothetical protein
VNTDTVRTKIAQVPALVDGLPTLDLPELIETVGDQAHRAAERLRVPGASRKRSGGHRFVLFLLMTGAALAVVVGFRRWQHSDDEHQGDHDR